MNTQHYHRLRDMWDEINSIHLSYLQTEECLKKIKEQDRLEDVIKQYLSVVPHNRKFFYGEIAYILRNSVRDKKDFSASKAILAWSALAKYAHNLLSQPWRKEFYEIQKYGGFFSHNIKCALIDWEIIFEMMGYKPEKDIMILEEPIDPDKITFVARDCFIAQVECQILLKIYAKVLKIHSECTWQDILDFRENHVCSAERAILDLSNIFAMRKQGDYARDACVPIRSAYAYSTLPSYDDTGSLRFPNEMKQLPQYPPNVLTNQSSHNRLGQPDFSTLPQDYELHNCTKHGMMTSNIHQLTPDSEYIPHCYPNNSYNLPYSPEKQPINTPYLFHRNNSSYCLDHGLPINERDYCSNCHSLSYGTIYGPYNCASCSKYFNHSYNYPASYRSRPTGKYDNVLKQSYDNQQWQRNAKESPVYSLNTAKYAPVTKSDLENAMKAFSFDELDKNTYSENEHSTKTSLSNSDSESKKMFTQPKTIDKSPEIHDDLWECSYCTYHNASKNVICEICGKSKNIGNENTPLISGGRECHKCTLVNERHASVCVACDASLKDSPTYI